MTDTSKNNWQHPLHKILEKGWYYDNNTVRVFFHLLLKANSISNKWQGIEIKRGSLITSRSKLANETNLSEREIRTSLSHLQETNEVTIKTTNRYSYISICKYDEYMCCQNLSDQQNDQESDQEVTSKTTNKRPTKRPAKITQKFTTDEGFSGSKKNNDQQNDQQMTSQSTTINNIYNNNINTFSNEKVSTPKGVLSVNACEGVEEEILDENIAKVTKGKNKSPTLVSKARKVFERFYQDQYGNAYYWTAKDGSNMKQLLQKFAFSRENRVPALPNDDDSLLDALTKFLDASFNKNWIADNFTVPNLNSQYNSIVSEHKNKLKQNKHGGTNSSRGSSPSYEERQRNVIEYVQQLIEEDYPPTQNSPRNNQSQEEIWRSSGEIVGGIQSPETN